MILQFYIIKNKNNGDNMNSGAINDTNGDENINNKNTNP